MARNLDQSEDKLNTGDSTGLRVLKILVVVMGVLIVAGVVAIVVTIANRMSDKAPPSPAVSVVAPPPKPFGEIAVALPSSARVISVSADAGRLYIHYETAGGQPSVMVMDAVSGNALGRLGFEPGRRATGSSISPATIPPAPRPR